MFFKKNHLINSFRHYGKWWSPNQPEPIKLAYTSYENTKIRYDAAPVIILHGLYGSRKNFRNVAQNIIEKLQPERKVKN